MNDQACPECQKIHQTAKAAEACLIAALNRSIITSTPEIDWKEQFRAIDIWCRMRDYYTELVRQPIGPSLVAQAYAVITELQHMPDCGTLYRGCAPNCPKALAEQGDNPNGR